MIQRLAFFILVSGLTACSTPDPCEDIKAVLLEQNEAWNNGDLESFFKGYWKSDKVVFAGGGTVHRGYKAMTDRYRKGYPTRERMGKLTFSELKFESITRNQVVVTGRWQLERETDNPGGVFTLIFRKFTDGWKIVHDHTSSERRKEK